MRWNTGLVTLCLVLRGYMSKWQQARSICARRANGEWRHLHMAVDAELPSFARPSRGP